MDSGDLVPPVGLNLKIGLGNGEIGLTAGTESLGLGDHFVGGVKILGVDNDPGFGLGDSVGTSNHEVPVHLDAKLLISVGLTEGVVEVLVGLTEEVQDLLDGVLVREVLGELDQDLDEVLVLKVLDKLLKMVLGLGDLHEAGVGVHQLLDEAEALSDGFDGVLVLLDINLVGLSVGSALSCSELHVVLGGGNESVVIGDGGLEVSLLGVEEVLKLVGLDTDVHLGALDSAVDLSIYLLMLSKLLSVVLSLGVDLEVEV